MADFDLNLLPIFNALMEERSVTRVGHRVGRTQSAISAALKRLREVFNDPLFVRTAEGLEPTPKAMELFETTTRIASLSDQCLRLEREFDPETDQAWFRIGAPDRLSLPVMMPLLARLRGIAPKVRVDLHSADRSRAVAQVRDKTLDMALISYDALPPELASRDLFAERLVCVVQDKHPLAGQHGPVEPEVLVAFDHLVVSSGGVRGTVFDRLLAERGLERSVGMTVPNFVFVPAILAASDMVGVFTERTAQVFQQQHGLALRQISPDLPAITHSLIWHRRTNEDRAHVWLRDEIAATVDALGLG